MEEVAPTPATRRSQRTAGRKAAAPEELQQPADDVSAEIMPSRSARSKMTMALDQEEELAAAMPKVEEKVQQEEPKAVASDVKGDDPDEDEVTKLLEGDNKEEEPEDGEEADSSDVTIGSAVASDKNCLDNMIEEEATKRQEGFVEEKESACVEKPASLATMEDSPILGVLSKAEASEPDIVKAQDASLEDGEGCAEWSPVMKMADEINEEAIQEDACLGETDHYPEEIVPLAAEEDDLTEVKERADDEMLQAELADNETSEELLVELKRAVDEMQQDNETNEELLAELKGAVDEMQQAELADNETSEQSDEEDCLAELKEEASIQMPQPELTDGEASDEDDEISSGVGSDEDEEIYSSEGNYEAEEISSAEDSDEEAGETSNESDTTDAVQMLQGTVIAEEAYEDASTEDDDESDTADVVQMLQGTVIAGKVDEDASTEDDDFSGDLPAEFDNLVFSDSDAENDASTPVLKENQAAVKSMVHSAITEEQKEEVSEGPDATEKTMKELDNIVNSLDEFTIKEGEAREEIQKLPQVENFESMSLRKLKSTLKERLIASKDGKVVAEGKRLPLEEVDENASVDC